jgi:hypothetical protein
VTLLQLEQLSSAMVDTVLFPLQKSRRHEALPFPRYFLIRTKWGCFLTPIYCNALLHRNCALLLIHPLRPTTFLVMMASFMYFLPKVR